MARSGEMIEAPKSSRATILGVRRPRGPGYHSVERVFDWIFAEMPPGFLENYTPSFGNRGIVPRIRACRELKRRVRPVNHVTGDANFLAFGLPGRTTVLTVLDCVNLHRLRGLKRKLLWWFWYALPIRRSAVITAISEFTRREVEAAVPGSTVRVVPCCVGPQFTPVVKDWPRENPRLLHLGVNPNKNLQRTMEALRGIDCTLCVVGRATDEARSLASKIGIRCDFAGSLSDAEVHEAYLRCDAVVFCSTYEGFGLPILEAQSIGRPIITSKVASMPEVAGDAAMFVDPVSVESIRDAIVEVLRSPDTRSRLVNAGFKNTARFAPRQVAQNYWEMYQEVAAMNRWVLPSWDRAHESSRARMVVF